MIKSTLPACVLAAVSFLICCSCTQGGKDDNDPSSKISVVATIPPMEYFAREIGGDRVEIVTLASAQTDPEQLELTISQMRKSAASDLVVTTGLFEFEEKLTGFLTSANSGMRLANLSDSLDLIMGTHGHDEADPHIWLSVRNARVMARNVARHLTAVSPADSALFAANLRSLDHRLDSLDNSFASRLAPGTSFVVWHPSLSYFARDYALEQIAIGEEHKELSVKQLASRIEKARAANPVVFFYQSDTDNRQAEAIRKEIGYPWETLTTLTDNPEKTLGEVTGHLSAGKDE